MRTQFTLSLTALLVLGIFAPATFGASADDYLGRWELTLNPSETKSTFNACWLQVDKDGDGLKSRLLIRWGSVFDPAKTELVDGSLKITNMNDKNQVTDIFVFTYNHHCLSGEILDPNGNPRGMTLWGSRAVEFVDTLNLTGKWRLVFHESQEIHHGFQLNFLQIGKISVGFVNQTELSEIALNGAELTVISKDEPKLKATVAIRGDRLEGKGQLGGKEMSVSGERLREWGEPIDLFNGKDVNNWIPRNPWEKPKWYVENGVMSNNPPDVDIVSKEVFSNYKLHVEFRMFKDSNSGIYQRGRYEVQLFDSFGKPMESHGMGAIYSRIIPTENATLPPLEWQTYDMLFVDRWITVVLNGKTIIDNQYLEGITGGALDPWQALPGPLMLQGDHGKVEFRKVQITPEK